MNKPYELSFMLSPPDGLNATLNKHWRGKRHYDRGIHRLVYYTTLGKIPPEPLGKFKLAFIRFSHRRYDFDNFVGALKPVVDGLRHAKIILNDSWKATGAWLVDQQIIRKTEQEKLWVYVTEAEGQTDVAGVFSGLNGSLRDLGRKYEGEKVA